MTAAIPEYTPIGGRYITVEPLTRDALPELFEAIGTPEVFAGGYAGGIGSYRDTVEGFVEWAERAYRFDDGHPYGIRLRGGRNDGLLVGTSTLADFEPVNEAAHIGWTAYDPRVWATAVNPEAKRLLIGRLFDSGFGRVRIQADAVNARSRAAIAKLGAQFEGVLRRAQARPDGTWRDTAVYSILADEWPAVMAGLDARLDAFGDRPVELA